MKAFVIALSMLFLMACTGKRRTAHHNDSWSDPFAEQRAHEEGVKALLRIIAEHGPTCFTGIRGPVNADSSGWVCTAAMPGADTTVLLHTDSAIVLRTHAYRSDPLEGFVLFKNAGYLNRDITGKTYAYSNFTEADDSTRYDLIHDPTEYFRVTWFKRNGFVQVDYVLHDCKP